VNLPFRNKTKLVIRFWRGTAWPSGR